MLYVYDSNWFGPWALTCKPLMTTINIWKNIYVTVRSMVNKN